MASGSPLKRRAFSPLAKADGPACMLSACIGWIRTASLPAGTDAIMGALAFPNGKAALAA